MFYYSWKIIIIFIIIINVIVILPSVFVKTNNSVRETFAEGRISVKLYSLYTFSILCVTDSPKLNRTNLVAFYGTGFVAFIHSKRHLRVRRMLLKKQII